jgi:uncharacterized protein YjbJ (UPF0337 family)
MSSDAMTLCAEEELSSIFLVSRVSLLKEEVMDKDRVKGSAQQAKGAVKEAAGKVTGDAKLQAEGKADKTAGKIRNAIGGLKDTLRGTRKS